MFPSLTVGTLLYKHKMSKGTDFHLTCKLLSESVICTSLNMPNFNRYVDVFNFF